MPILTEGAARFLEDALERSEREDAVVRLVRSSPGWALRIDRPREGDEVFEREGRTVLAIADEIADELTAAVIELLETDRGPRLRIKHD